MKSTENERLIREYLYTVDMTLSMESGLPVF